MLNGEVGKGKRRSPNEALWARIMPEILDYLAKNPYASARDTGAHFNMPESAIALRLKGVVDFWARRKARGEANRQAARDARAARLAREVASLRNEGSTLLRKDGQPDLRKFSKTEHLRPFSGMGYVNGTVKRIEAKLDLILTGLGIKYEGEEPSAS